MSHRPARAHVAPVLALTLPQQLELLAARWELLTDMVPKSAMISKTVATHMMAFIFRLLTLTPTRFSARTLDAWRDVTSEFERDCIASSRTARRHRGKGAQ